MRVVADVSELSDARRAALVRRGLRLNYLTIGYNALEAAASLAAGVLAGSVALVGFGVDSLIELTASGAAQWRLRADWRPERRERVERLSRRIVGWSFLALTAYVVGDSLHALWLHDEPRRSLPGIVVLAFSAVVMPLLARAKRRVARALRSDTLEGEAMQTALCAWLSVIALAGVALNALAGWWWADPAAALLMVPLIAREGLEGVRGEACCQDASCAR